MPQYRAARPNLVKQTGCMGSLDRYTRYSPTAVVQVPGLIHHGIHSPCSCTGPLVIGEIFRSGPGRRTRQDFEARIKDHQGGSRLAEDAGITFHFRCTVCDLRLHGLYTHHGLLEIRAVDKEGQIGIVREIAFDIGQRCVGQLNEELFAIVRRNQVNGESTCLEGAVSVDTAMRVTLLCVWRYQSNRGDQNRTFMYRLPEAVKGDRMAGATNAMVSRNDYHSCKPRSWVHL